MVPAALQPCSDVSQSKDFTRFLPLQLSMAILGLLDETSLVACSAVNRHWAFLVSQVRAEQECWSLVQQSLLELQELCPKKTIPNYAKRVNVQIPQLNAEGEVIEVDDKEQNKRRKSKSEDFSLHAAYRELKICKVKLEERNVFCGSYKTHVLMEQCWNIRSGACVRTFTGHYGTITCLDSHQEHFVSGAGDGMVKVWSLKSGKCVKILMHNSPVGAVRMDGTHVVSACHQGLVKVWSAETGALIKTLERHQGPVLCLSFDQWHLVTGSSDGYALGWSMVGKLKRCLIAFFHPK